MSSWISCIHLLPLLLTERLRSWRQQQQQQQQLWRCNSSRPWQSMRRRSGYHIIKWSLKGSSCVVLAGTAAAAALQAASPTSRHYKQQRQYKQQQQQLWRYNSSRPWQYMCRRSGYHITRGKLRLSGFVAGPAWAEAVAGLLSHRSRSRGRSREKILGKHWENLCGRVVTMAVAAAAAAAAAAMEVQQLAAMAIHVQEERLSHN